MRKGTLTDRQTLTLYKRGESLITLAIHEGMTVYGVSGRLHRARKDNGELGVHRKPSKYQPIINITTLENQLIELNLAVRRMKREPV